jgi:hypothetical protein
MPIRFQQIALIGKYPNPQSTAQLSGVRDVLQDIATFLSGLGCGVCLEQETANHTGLQGLRQSRAGTGKIQRKTSANGAPQRKRAGQPRPSRPAVTIYEL